MLGIIIWGAFLYAGATKFELKWALIVALSAAVAFTLLGSALVQNDPLCGVYADCSVNAARVAYNVAMKFAIAMFFYSIGRGGAAFYTRLRGKPHSEE